MTPARQTAREPHECREPRACSCRPEALEPDERCPVHGGGEWPPRCEVCGRFLPRRPAPVPAVAAKEVSR